MNTNRDLFTCERFGILEKEGGLVGRNILSFFQKADIKNSKHRKRMKSLSVSNKLIELKWVFLFSTLQVELPGTPDRLIITSVMLQQKSIINFTFSHITYAWERFIH